MDPQEKGLTYTNKYVIYYFGGKKGLNTRFDLVAAKKLISIIR